VFARLITWKSRLLRRHSPKRMRTALALAVCAVAGVFATNAAAGVTFSDGTWVESAALCSYYETGFGYVTAYYGIDYASRAGVYGKSRRWKWIGGRWVVDLTWQANWYPLAQGLSTLLQSSRLDRDVGQFAYEMLYGKYVGGVWQTRTQWMRVANYSDNNLSGVDPWKVLNLPNITSNIVCDNRYPGIEIITPNQ
jgi:hypothetical protein